MIALAVLVAPVALFGLFHKTRLHFIGIQYRTPDSKQAGILLQGDKDNYRAILVALQGVTGAPVSVAEKEREFVPVGVTTNVTRGSEEQGNTVANSAVQTAPTNATGTISLVSNPSGADIYVDEQFHGNSPTTLKLTPGRHRITVKMAGYHEWSRDLSTEVGSALNVTAALERSN